MARLARGWNVIGVVIIYSDLGKRMSMQQAGERQQTYQHSWTCLLKMQNS